MALAHLSVASITERQEVPYKNESQRFLLDSVDYSHQFAPLYAYRLKEFTKLLKTKIETQWGKEYPIKKLHELREENVEKCIVIGTLFKHQMFKPSILREICEENQLAPPPPNLHYSDKADLLMLEDELQRVRLVGNVEVHNLVTGVVIAILGNIEENGKFFVDDCIFYESGPQTKLSKLENRPFIVIMSGLDQVNSFKYSMSLDLLQQWLTGNVFNAAKYKYVRIIIAGNSYRNSSRSIQSTLQPAKFKDATSDNSIEELDECFACWSQSINLDVMPGEFDPSNLMLPQQPLHQCLFPKANKNESFALASNPYSFRIADRLVVGTSGQNILNILKLTEIEKPMKALKCSLEWGHIAPTAPDTLPLYPYVDSDPFIIRECPHIYFSGNADRYETELWRSVDGKKTRLICVPSFAKTQSIVTVDLNNLDCRSISFNYNKIGK